MNKVEIHNLAHPRKQPKDICRRLSGLVVKYKITHEPNSKALDK